jgi:hypothetical protein
VDDSFLEPGERRLLEALDELGVRFLVVGLGAAVMQGAPVVTQDIDLWFEDRTDPRIHGAIGERIDVVTTPEGLDSFAAEYGGARVFELDGVPVRVLPLERVIQSKRAAGRAKDLAVLPALEAALAVLRGD